MHHDYHRLLFCLATIIVLSFPNQCCWLMCYLLLCQRLDVSCLTHDHGADVTKGVRLSAVHSLLCIDHELDLTVNAGIECPEFYPIFRESVGYREHSAKFRQPLSSAQR